MHDGPPLTQFQRGILRRLTIALVMIGVIWLAEYGHRNQDESDEFAKFDAKLAAFKTYVSAHPPKNNYEYLAFVNHFESQWHTNSECGAAILLGIAKQVRVQQKEDEAIQEILKSGQQ